MRLAKWFDLSSAKRITHYSLINFQVSSDAKNTWDAIRVHRHESPHGLLKPSLAAAWALRVSSLI